MKQKQKMMNKKPLTRRVYLAHPYESTGTVEENRMDEERIANELEKTAKYFKLVRPFKLISPTIKRKRAIDLGLLFLKKCSAILMSGDWKKSKGCLNELSTALKSNKTVYEYKDDGTIRILTEAYIRRTIDGFKRQDN